MREADIMDKILVAGATGNLGRYVTRELKGRGYWIRALVRDLARLEVIGDQVDDVFAGDVTRPDTLARACDGVDVVFSSVGRSLGLRRSGDRGEFRDVDYQGNRNLLDVALKSDVRRFVYVSVFGAEMFADLEYVKAHEDFVRELQASGLECAIVRPTAFYFVLGEELRLSKSGRAMVIGDGRKGINPVHEVDVAAVCADAIVGQQGEISVGGPMVYTRTQLAEMGFAALGRKGKLIRLPVWLASLLTAVIRPFDKRLSALVAFGSAAMQVDCVAPQSGTRQLEEYYQEVAQALRG